MRTSTMNTVLDNQFTRYVNKILPNLLNEHRCLVDVPWTLESAWDCDEKIEYIRKTSLNPSHSSTTDLFACSLARLAEVAMGNEDLIISQGVQRRHGSELGICQKLMYGMIHSKEDATDNCFLPETIIRKHWMGELPGFCINNGVLLAFNSGYSLQLRKHLYESTLEYSLRSAFHNFLNSTKTIEHLPTDMLDACNLVAIAIAYRLRSPMNYTYIDGYYKWFYKATPTSICELDAGRQFLQSTRPYLVKYWDIWKALDMSYQEAVTAFMDYVEVESEELPELVE